MPLNGDEIINMCSMLAESENLKVAVKESAKGAAIIGTSAFVGGLLGGRVGLAAGGLLSSLLVLGTGQGNYRSVLDVIRYDMTRTQQSRLAASVQNIIQDLHVEDVTTLLPLVLANSNMKEMVLKEIVTFMQREMNLNVLQ